MTEVPQWWPNHPAIYDIRKSWFENVQSGPSMHGMPIPPRKYLPKDKWIDFLGFKVASPLGVPAGPLLDSQWTGLAAQLGFDVVTYKTIRSNRYDGHPAPNVIFVDPNEVTSSLKTNDEINHPINSINYEPKSIEMMAITNSFGMPSMSLEYLKTDIPKANSLLQDGQVMIVSVVGTPSHTNDKSQDYTNFVKDFTEIALFAKNCGASIVEANFSCPNVISGEGSIYSDVKSVRDISSAITNVLGETPFMIKVGQYRDDSLLTEVLKAASQSKVRGVCGLNSVSMKVVDPATKKPALGENRLVSGICGAPIRENALHFVKSARRVIDKEQLNLTLVGCGGVTTKEHFTEFVNAGATVAMSATGMMWDPYLALRYHNE